MKQIILEKGNFTLQEKLEITNLFSNIKNKKNLIVEFELDIKKLIGITINTKKVEYKKYKITDEIKINKNTKALFLFAFLKNSNEMIEKYNKIREKIKINNIDFFHSLRRSFKNEGIYLLEFY